MISLQQYSYYKIYYYTISLQQYCYCMILLQRWMNLLCLKVGG